VPELADIVRRIEENDGGIWEKVLSLDGARFEVKLACNSQRLQRIFLNQLSWRPRVVRGDGVRLHGTTRKQMPNELKEIVDICSNDDKFIDRVAVWSTGKFDIVFTCAGGGLDEEPLLKDVS